jgi:chromosome segregation ATPase
MSVLTDRERSIKHLEATRQMQILEIQNRWATLQQYANELVDMDKQLRAAENDFEVRYDNRLQELADQEEESLHVMARIREQKQQLEQRVVAYTQISTTILNTIADTTKEEAELKVNVVNIESLTPKAREQIAQVSLERLHFDLDECQTQVQTCASDIDRQTIIVKQISSQSAELMQKLNAVLSQKRGLEAERQKLQDSNGREVSELSDHIEQSKAEYQQTSDEEIRTLAMQSLTKKSIKSLKQRLSDCHRSRIAFEMEVQPRREQLLLQSSDLASVQTDTHRYREAMDRQEEFRRGIKESTERAQLRESEIAVLLEQIRAQRKHVAIEKFMCDDAIETSTESECGVRKKLAVVDQEAQIFAEEEEEFDRDYDAVSNEVRERQSLDSSAQEMRDRTSEVYQKLKDRIAEVRKDEKHIVRRIKELREDIGPVDGPEIDKETRRVGILVKGYETQIKYRSDQIVNLTQAIRCEMLKQSVSGAEHKRMSYESSSLVGGDLSALTERQDDRNRNVRTLADDVADLQQRAEELQSRLTNRRLLLTDKAQQLAVDEEGLPVTSKRGNLSEVGVRLQASAALAEKFTARTEPAVQKVQTEVEFWRQNSGFDPDAMKRWFQVVTSLIDECEDLQLHSDLSRS